jgi:uncharacterized repeat protein (TIGR02059 family)
MFVKIWVAMKCGIFMVLLTLSLTAQATDYYVKKTGNDSSDGKSDATAWATISKVNSTRFSAGDVIHFNCGDTWRDMLTVSASGTSSAYIKYTKYGTGENPRILGSNATTWSNYSGNIWVSDGTFINPRSVGQEGAEVFFENSSGYASWGKYKTSITSCTAEFNWAYSASHIYIYSPTDPNTRYNSVEVPQRAFIVDLHYMNYIHIDGIDLRYCGYAGVQFDAGDGGWQAKTGLIIENLDLSYISTQMSEAGYGTQAVYSDMIVRNCEIHDCGRRSLSFHIYGQIAVDNVLIENNYFHHGFHTHMDMQNNNRTFSNFIIRNNIFDDQDTYSNADCNQILMQNSGGTAFDEIYVYNNLFIRPKLYGILEEGTIGQTYIWNNVFIGPSQLGQCCLEIQAMNGQSHADVRNNIFYSTGRRELEIENGQSAAYVTLYNNCFYNATSNMGYGTDYITSNPLFVSAAAKDFHLQSSSPAIGAGIDVGLSADFDGNAYGNPPNMGCYSSTGVAPSLTYISSVIENATPSVLEMTYNLSLTNIVPATSAFTVMINSTVRSVSSVSISGTKVALTLSSPVAYGDVVTVAYTKPSANPLQTSTGSEAESFAAKYVTNNVASTEPVYVSSVIQDATPSVLEMTYSLTLADIVPATSAFTVRVNSATRTVSSVSVSGTKVSLTLSSPVEYGDVVTIAYTKPWRNPLQTSSGGQVASMTAQSVTNNVAATIPVYVSSVIQNATPSVLEMTYSLTLANIIPATSAFTVSVNSTTRTVSSVSVSGTKVSLTLSSPVVNGDVVTVAYTKPSASPLQTATGGQVASMAAQSVTNNVGATIPVYVSSVIQNTTPTVLEMTYSLSLANIVPATSAFAVRVNSTTRTVSSVSVSGTKVSLTLSSPVEYGDVVTIAYTKPSTDPLQTTSGGQVASMGAQSVTNNVAAAIPVYVSSVIQNTTPTVLEMTYSLSLANIVPATSAFTVRVNSTTRTVSSVSVSGTKVSLTLSSPVVNGDVVTVAYTKPWTNPLQTSSGGEAASIGNQSVVNNVSAPANQPPVVSISSPTKNSSFVAPATIVIDATASDPDGTVSKIEFYNGNTKLGECTSLPYSFTWKEVPEGTYELTAVAIDNLNARTVSDHVFITVTKSTPVVNQLPIVSVSARKKNKHYKKHDNLVIDISAEDPDGSVSKVEIKNGSITIAEMTESPYTYTIMDADTGMYVITAIATDNLGAVSVSETLELFVEEYGPNSEMIDIYPNPNNGHFAIDLHSGFPAHHNRIRIVSISGVLVYDEEIDEQESFREFHLEGKINPGIYFMMVTNGKKVYSTRRFIKR